MKYSLLVPCYNAQAYIDNFIQGLSKLNIGFDEIIFFDDASTDDTYQQLSSKGFTVISGKTNKGPGYARNHLAAAAHGEYIHFHDIDDEFNPAFLQLVDEKAGTDITDVILGNADWIDASTRETVIEWRYDEADVLKNPLAYFIGHPLGIINTVYKKAAFLKVGGFNENIKCWEDADLHIRLAASGASFKVINEILAYSLRHDNGISQNQQWCWDCRLNFLKNYLNDYQGLLNNNVFQKELKNVQNEFIRSSRYDKLADIIMLNKRYHLNMDTHKVSLLYYINKIVPSAIINRILKLLYNN